MSTRRANTLGGSSRCWTPDGGSHAELAIRTQERQQLVTMLWDHDFIPAVYLQEFER
jgi:hypothetical protein